MTPITIAITDDHRVVTASLKAYLESFPDMRVVGVAKSGESLLENVAAWAPQVALLDLLMPGGIDGVETARRMQTAAPSVRVIALTASMDEARMMAVLRAGAVGYVRKDADPEVLLAAIRAVAAGKTFIDPAVARKLVGAEDESRIDLTTRELHVLRHVALGRTNKDIAQVLDISEETVKSHVANVLGKLLVENRAQAIVQALKRGIVTLDELA
jgi:NarL family two-component system response regulator LiaR